MNQPNCVFISLLLCLLLPSAANAQPPSLPRVEVLPVVEKTMAPVMWVPGTVISREDARLAPEVAGVLNTVVEVGTQVERGQVLARINDRQWQLQLRQNQADIERLAVQHAFTEKQLARTLRLAQSNSTAAFRLDELTMQRNVLEQEIILAQVARDQTQYLLQRTQITAPFPGVVAERFAQAGEHISVGEELLRLVNPQALEVRAQAPVEIHEFITHRAQVAIKAKDKHRLTQLRSIVPVGDQRSRMLEVRVQLTTDWVIGEAVTVALHNGPEQVVKTLPRDALVLRDEEIFVYRINADEVAEKVSVVPGLSDGASIAVSGDLHAGDQVVIRGAERLADGAKVTTVTPLAGH